MKTFNLLLLLVGTTFASLAQAESPVRESLEKMSFFNATPNPQADYYIILRSASWCPPCQHSMPHYVKIYQEMKKSGKVELILWSADKDQPSAQSFVNEHSASFPVTMDAQVLRNICQGRSVPRAYVLDKFGKLLYSGHGNILKTWRYATLDYEKNKPEIEAQMALKAKNQSR